MDAVIQVPFINIVILFLSSSIMQHANCWWVTIKVSNLRESPVHQESLSDQDIQEFLLNPKVNHTYWTFSLADSHKKKLLLWCEVCGRLCTSTSSLHVHSLRRHLMLPVVNTVVVLSYRCSKLNLGAFDVLYHRSISKILQTWINSVQTGT